MTIAFLALPMLLNGVGSPLPVPSGWSAEVLGAEARFGDLEDGLLSYLVSEAESGADMNGDGDLLDLVQEIRIGAGPPILTGLASGGSYVTHEHDGSPWATLAISESSQASTDFNGDGDVEDLIYFLYDVTSGEAFNSTLEPSKVQEPVFGRGGIITRHSELQESFPFIDFVDLNGDGDFNDELNRSWSRYTGTVQWLTEGWLPHTRILPGDTALIPIRESGPQFDYNGDGDQTDYLPAIYNFATDDLVVLPAVVSRLDGILLEGSVNLLPLSEVQSSLDFNGDGDMSDDVLFLTDPATGSVIPTGLALVFGKSIAREQEVTSILFREDTFDLNGDGDLGDQVLVFLDDKTGTVGVAPFDSVGLPVVTPEFVFYSVFEDGVDLDDDGDQEQALFSFNRRTGETFPVPGVVADNSTLEHLAGETAIVYSISEWNSEIDFNGDGELGLGFAFAYDLTTRSSQPLVDHVGLAKRLAGQTLVAEYGEASFAQIDHNQDGDGFDRFVSFTDVTTGVSEVVIWGTTKIVAVSRDTVVLETSELGFGDVNGDGDETDENVLVLLTR